MKYVVAWDQKEADKLVYKIGLDTLKEAEDRLRKVQAPPTDPDYAAKYKIYRCQDK